MRGRGVRHLKSGIDQLLLAATEPHGEAGTGCCWFHLAGMETVIYLLQVGISGSRPNKVKELSL